MLAALSSHSAEESARLSPPPALSHSGSKKGTETRTECTADNLSIKINKLKGTLLLEAYLTFMELFYLWPHQDFRLWIIINWIMTKLVIGDPVDSPRGQYQSCVQTCQAPPDTT